MSVDPTKENAAPFDAAWNPQYALFRKFMQNANADSGYSILPLPAVSARQNNPDSIGLLAQESRDIIGFHTVLFQSPYRV